MRSASSCVISPFRVVSTVPNCFAISSAMIAARAGSSGRSEGSFSRSAAAASGDGFFRSLATASAAAPVSFANASRIFASEPDFFFRGVVIKSDSSPGAALLVSGRPLNGACAGGSGAFSRVKPVAFSSSSCLTIQPAPLRVAATFADFCAQLYH